MLARVGWRGLGRDEGLGMLVGVGLVFGVGLGSGIGVGADSSVPCGGTELNFGAAAEERLGGGFWSGSGFGVVVCSFVGGLGLGLGGEGAELGFGLGVVAACGGEAEEGEEGGEGEASG